MKRIPKVGDRVHYTGDMANLPKSGVVSSLRGANQFDLTWDENEGQALGLYFSMLAPADKPYERFYFEDEWLAYRKAQIISQYWSAA